MRKVLLILASGLFAVAGTAVPATSQAADKPNILIMGEDADPVSVPRGNRVFGRVLDAISDELHSQGFDVFDENSVSAIPIEGRIRRDDRKIINVARSIRQPLIDVIAIFSIFANPEHFSQRTKVSIRVEGRLLNVKSGQRLGNFEVLSPDSWSAPVDCPRNCILEVIGKYSLLLGREVAAVLAEKLDDMTQVNPVDGTIHKSNKLDRNRLLLDSSMPLVERRDNKG